MSILDANGLRCFAYSSETAARPRDRSRSGDGPRRRLRGSRRSRDSGRGAAPHNRRTPLTYDRGFYRNSANSGDTARPTAAARQIERHATTGCWPSTARVRRRSRIAQPPRDELRVLDHVRGVADQPWSQDLRVWQLHVLPNHPLVFVTRVRRFQQVRAGVHEQHQIDDVSKPGIRHVRVVLTAPAWLDRERDGRSVKQRSRATDAYLPLIRAKSGRPRARSRASHCCGCSGRLATRPACVWSKRALKEVRQEWSREHRRIYRPWVSAPAEFLIVDWGDVGSVQTAAGERKLLCFCAVLGWSRWKYVRFFTAQRFRSACAGPGGVLRAAR
jgi:hypothetical protein